MASIAGTVREAGTGIPLDDQQVKIYDLDNIEYFASPPFPAGIIYPNVYVTTDTLGEYSTSLGSIDGDRCLVCCSGLSGSPTHYPKWHNNENGIYTADELIVAGDMTGVDFDLNVGTDILSGTTSNAPPATSNIYIIGCEYLSLYGPFWIWIKAVSLGAWLATAAHNPSIPYKVSFTALDAGFTLLDDGWFCGRDSGAVACADNAYGGESNVGHNFGMALPCPEATLPYCTELEDLSRKAGSLLQRRCRGRG